MFPLHSHPPAPIRRIGCGSGGRSVEAEQLVQTGNAALDGRLAGIHLLAGEPLPAPFELEGGVIVGKSGHLAHSAPALTGRHGSCCPPCTADQLLIVLP